MKAEILLILLLSIFLEPAFGNNYCSESLPGFTDTKYTYPQSVLKEFVLFRSEKGRNMVYPTRLFVVTDESIDDVFSNMTKIFSENRYKVVVNKREEGIVGGDEMLAPYLRSVLEKEGIASGLVNVTEFITGSFNLDDKRKASSVLTVKLVSTDEILGRKGTIIVISRFDRGYIWKSTHYIVPIFIDFDRRLVTGTEFGLVRSALQTDQKKSLSYYCATYGKKFIVEWSENVDVLLSIRKWLTEAQ